MRKKAASSNQELENKKNKKKADESHETGLPIKKSPLMEVSGSGTKSDEKSKKGKEKEARSNPHPPPQRRDLIKKEEDHELPLSVRTMEDEERRPQMMRRDHLNKRQLRSDSDLEKAKKMKENQDKERRSQALHHLKEKKMRRESDEKSKKMKKEASRTNSSPELALGLNRENNKEVTSDSESDEPRIGLEFSVPRKKRTARLCGFPQYLFPPKKKRRFRQQHLVQRYSTRFFYSFCEKNGYSPVN